MDMALQAALLGATMGSAVLAASALYGWMKPVSGPAFGWWAIAFSFETFSRALLLAGGETILVQTSDFLHGLGACLALCGAFAFMGRRIAQPVVAMGVVVGMGWMLVAQQLRAHQLHSLPLLGLGGLPLLFTAWVIWRRGSAFPDDARRPAALVFAVGGLHYLAAPLLHGGVWGATFSLMLSQLLSMVTALALLLMIMRRQHHLAETAGTHAEIVLRQTVAWLRGIMDTVVDGIVTSDETGTILSFNPAACRIFGYSADEVVGRSLTMLMPQAYASQHFDHMRGEVLGVGRQVEGLRKDRTVFPLDISIAEMRQGDSVTFIGVLRDMTERKQVEGALQDSERRYRELAEQRQAIIDNIGAGLAVFDDDERPVALNRQARQMLGLPDCAAADSFTCIEDMFRLLAEQGEFGAGSAERQAAVRLKRMRSHPDQIIEHTRPDGTVLEVRSNRMPDGGRILTFSDMTGRKRVEASLREAKNAAERGNRAKATFLANISHELRTPLNAIIGFSELMKFGILGPLQPEVYGSYMEDIHSSGMHLLGLINDILDMSKAEAGMTDIVDTLVDLPVVIRSAVRMTVRRAEVSGVRVIEDVPENLPLLRADERRVRQIVLNLVSNAVKFTDEGGEVTVRLRADDGLILSVSDTGIGMTPDELERVMEPFVQADTSLSRKYEGTGLGLPLTKALIEAHGGTLTLDSVPGAGTTATATFPRARMVGGPMSRQSDMDETALRG